MKKLICIILLLFFIKSVMADVVINEIMYNPDQCSDSYCEWIELYNTGNESINLSEWTIDGNNFDDIIIEANGYVIVARNIEGYSSYYNIDYAVVDGSFILGNTEDNIILTNGSYIDILNYNSSWGANGNNYTLEKINSNETNSEQNWNVGLIKDGTPGRENSLFGFNVRYENITIVEFLPNPNGDDNAPMPLGEWIEIYNSGEDINLQWSYFEDSFGHRVYVTDTTTINSTVESEGYLVVYMNGFSGFLNNDGIEEIKFYDRNGSLIDKISYEGSDEGSSWAKVGDYWQKTMPTPNEENVDSTNVKNSKFEIITVYDLGSDKIAKFGQVIRAKVDLYKGDETKNVLRMWVEGEGHRISKESKITLSKKYTEVSLAVPIQLNANCREKYEDGEYEIVIGWTSESSIKHSFPLIVEGLTNSLCEKVEVEKSTSTSSKKFVYSIVKKPEEVDVGDYFESEVSLTNNDDEDFDIDIWSYVYRGNKAYSGEREENKETFVLKEGSTNIIKLKNKVEDAKTGEYNFKVKIRKNNQKTTKDITETIRLKKEIYVSDELDNGLQWTEALIYESTSFKARKMVPYFFILTLSLLMVGVVFKKN